MNKSDGNCLSTRKDIRVFRSISVKKEKKEIFSLSWRRKKKLFSEIILLVTNRYIYIHLRVKRKKNTKKLNMTNPPSPRFSGMIRDVRTSKRNLQQTFSQVFFHSPLCSLLFLSLSQQQQQLQQVRMRNDPILQELVLLQRLFLIPFINKQCKRQMKCYEQKFIV